MAQVAIEIDQDRIYLAATQTASRRTQLKHAISFDAGGDDQNVIEALRDEVAKLGLTKSDATVVLRRDDVELRPLQVPPTPANDLPGMIKFIAKNEFAAANESWSLDFIRLTGDQDTPGRVMAGGISPEMNQRVRRIVESAGLRLKSILYRPFAVAKFLVEKLNSDQPIAIVELLDQHCEISLFRQQKMLAARKFRIVGDPAKLMVREIKRTIAAQAELLDGQPVISIQLFGDAGQLSPLGPSIAQAVEIPCQIVDPVDDRMFGSDLKGVANANRIAALIGGLQSNEQSGIESFDFLNPRQPVVERGNAGKWKIYGMIAAAVLLLMFAFGWWSLSNQSAEIEQQRTSLAKLTAKNQGDGVNPAVADTLEEVGAIDQWMAASTNWQENLLNYSQQALTADDVIVDRFDGSVKTRDNTISMEVDTRSANDSSEAALVQKLSELFDVKPGKSEILSAGDYLSKLKLSIAVPTDSSGMIKQIDKRAEQYLNEIRKANAARAVANSNQ